FSQALRRTAVKFGIGRYLYNLPDLWIPITTTFSQGMESVYYKGSYRYYTKPDLTQYTGQPDNTVTKPAATKSANDAIKQSGTVSENNTEQPDAPAAISTAEFRDYQTRLAPLSQGNPTAMQMIGLSAKETDSMGRISKLLGACYNLFAVGSKEQKDIGLVMADKQLPDMVICLKNCLITLEASK
ncbi:hypothetical protein KAR91_68205, partial [Candidatus Pacearchaeota archaeon]|nr:hypothetical protein [Candidatus Pacearchaeota archaeon]